MRQVCVVDGCGSHRKGLGYCDKHYQRVRRYGSPDGGPKAQAPAEERFWRHVERRGDEDCWEWTGSVLRSGYGRFSRGTKADGAVSAHRFSCAAHHGEPPFVGANVMHSCDNRRCVNPSHLRWATASDNIQDAYDKRRKVSPFKIGEEHHCAVLNEAQARFIKAHPAMRTSEFAKLFGCSRSAIDAIKQGRTWKHIE